MKKILQGIVFFFLGAVLLLELKFTRDTLGRALEGAWFGWKLISCYMVGKAFWFYWIEEKKPTDAEASDE